MARLQYYDKEDAALKALGFDLDRVVSEAEATNVIKKLARHFKMVTPEIKFYGVIDYGLSYNNSYKIKLAHNPTIGTVIHELGHQYLDQQLVDHGTLSQLFAKRKAAHTKKLLRIVKRFAKYVMKKEYWGVGLNG